VDEEDQLRRDGDTGGNGSGEGIAAGTRGRGDAVFMVHSLISILTLLNKMMFF